MIWQLTERLNSTITKAKSSISKRISERLSLRSAEILVLVIFFLFSLRVVNWFHYPYIMVSGDFRPPFNAEAFAKRVVYTWDEIDFGMPSIYSPRILDPFYFLVTILQTGGLNLYMSEEIAVFLLYFLSATLTYLFVKQLTSDTTISFVAALFFVSNVYLINDREATAIGFIDLGLTIMPCLLLFTMSIRKRSYKLIAASGVLFVLTSGGFPNYRTSLICLVMLALISIFFFLKRFNITLDKRDSRTFLSISLNSNRLGQYVKIVGLFFAVSLLASLWTIVIVSSNFDALVKTYSVMSAPSFAVGLGIYDVTRLIARWGFYSGALDMPYIPYAANYLANPLVIFLCFLPAALAFLSLLVSERHKTTIFFGTVAVIFIFLASGFSFSVYGNKLYLDLLDFLMLKAFREASNWVFFVIISFGILIGCTVSGLCHKLKNRFSKALLTVFVVAMFLSSTYPLTTGDVTRNWLRPSIKGSYLPPSYLELNAMLSSQHWSVLTGGRETYIVYNFTEGPLGCGNPYPLIFSKPVISGVGTEYLQSENIQLIDELHRLMRTDQNIAPEGKAFASSMEDDRYLPKNAIDGSLQTRWSSQMSVPQWLEIAWGEVRHISNITIFFESAFAEDYTIQTWNGTTWTTQLTVHNNTSTEISHFFPNPINATRLRLYFMKATERFPSVSLWELEIYTRNIGVPKFLGVLGIRQVIVEKNILLGSTSSLKDMPLSDGQGFILVKDWNEVSLYNTTHALERLYVGDKTIGYETLDEMYRIVEDSEWDVLQRSIFVNTASTPQATTKTLVLPTNLAWIQRSPTSYEAHVQSRGAFFLVFLESYDLRWKLHVNGSAVPEENHMKVNAFANGWLIDTPGDLTVSIEYETQNLLNMAFVASIALPGLLLAFLSREELKKIDHLVRKRFRRKTTGTSKTDQSSVVKV